MSNKIISPIAIDMGAKNTGVYLNHFEQGEDPTTSNNSQGKTIVIDSANITLSQVSRTQKRHQIRTNKRRKLSKRLLKLILTEYGIIANPKQQEYLNGLLNNRGYTYLVDGLDYGLIQQFFVAEYFVKKHNDFFNNKATFYNDFLTISNDIEKSKSLYRVLTLSKNDAKKAVDENKQEFADAYDNIKKVLKTQIKAEDEGHKYRAKYLANIGQDIKQNALIKPLLSNDLTAEKLACLIGNISNLQLRILRKYFNDKAMKSGDKWQPKKLHELFFKWVRSWHAKQDNEKHNRQELLTLQKKNGDILDIFTTFNPAKTIPPYEDQNNRRPPKDLTLRLKPASLDNYLSNWESITEALTENYILPQTNEHIKEEIDIQEELRENIRLQKGSNETKERQILADTLHRILDRTTALDPYKLRLLAQDSDKPDAKTAKASLNKHSNNQADNIIVFAKKYYAEVDIAKQGLWTKDGSLFFRCETNPPHKGNIQHRLVGHILREDFPLNPKTKKNERLEAFKKECWDKKIKGKSTTKSLAEKIEETRKEYGNAFNYIVRNIQRRQYVLNKETNKITQEQKNRWDKYEKEHENVVKAIKNAGLIADKIAEYFKHDDTKRGKYKSPYSIAQLYNHLETEISGFSKTDKWNTEENAWRNKEQSIEILNKAGEAITLTLSNASRLTADSIRPFDGMLDRIISRQAIEIVRMKIQQIEQLNIDKNDRLFVPIFMEQNRFEFEQSLHEIKGLNNIKKKAKDRVKKGLEKQTKQWEEKDERIKKNKYCPYTDEKIGAGELDHIIPQAKSKRHGDVVFNSEANLIYCSRTGNTNKGDERWVFSQLQPKYLTEIFGNANTQEIQQKIKNFIHSLDKNDPISFHNLEKKEQNYLRHALFIPELDGETFPILNTRYKAIVNGTQGYLGKQIRKLLQEKYPNVEVKTYQIPAQEVHQLRDILGKCYKELEKSNRQGAFSHVIDASLVLATALKNEKIAKELTTTNLVNESEKAEWLKDLLPKSVDVLHIKRKPKYRKELQSTQIFKEGLYGERFLSILSDNEKLYYGFALDNCDKIKLDKKQGVTTVEAYFELLKPFLYTGSNRKNNKKPVRGNLADNSQQYAYFSIDKTKAVTHLQKCAKEICNDEEIRQAVELEKLRYSVEKKNIKKTLLTGQGKKTFIEKEKLFDKKFKVSGLWLPAKTQWEQFINHSITDLNGKKTTLEKCFGEPEQVELDNPDMLHFWQDLSAESGLEIDYLKDNLLKKNDKGEFSKKLGIIPKKVFNAKIKADDIAKELKDSTLLKKSFGLEFRIEKDLIPQSSWDKLFKEFFLCKYNKDNKQYEEKKNRTKRGKHKPVRKDYSLPVVSAPSGGFRIKRKNPLTAEAVYQVSGIEGFATKGYDSTLKTPVLIDRLTDSPNIAPIEGKQKPVNEVCYFDEWKSIKLPDELSKKINSLAYAIGSKDRFYIRVAMPFGQFKELDDTITHFSNVPTELKEPKKNDTWKFKKTNFQKYFMVDNSKIALLGKPRSNLFVEFVDDKQIIFFYIVESINKEMKTAYQNGTPIK